MKYLKNLIILFLVPFCMCYANPKSKTLDTLATIGSVATKVSATYFASQEKGLGHMAIIYLQSSLIHKQLKFNVPLPNSMRIRPDNSPFGFPSGHMGQLWFFASYTRNFSKNKKLCIPMYASGLLMGVERVISKRHTLLQVVAGALVPELVNTVNANLGWSKHYVGFDCFSGLQFHFRI